MTDSSDNILRAAQLILSERTDPLFFGIEELRIIITAVGEAAIKLGAVVVSVAPPDDAGADKACPKCGGSGLMSTEHFCSNVKKSVTCNCCNGSGVAPPPLNQNRPTLTPPPQNPIPGFGQRTCPTCNGTGIVNFGEFGFDEHNCATCFGTGIL